MRVADYIFEFVARLGIKQVFLLPGGGAMHLVDALGQNSDLEFIATHHEQAAGIAAEAYSRVSENLGVALVTTGPGGLNVLTPVAGAWIESVPLLIVSGQVKRADLVGSKGVRQMGVQEVDVASVAKPITKYAVTVMEPESIRYHLEKAVALAKHGRQGPVWLDVPLDVQAAPVDPDDLTGFDANELKPVTSPVQLNHWVDETLALLKSARRPLLLAGHGIRLAGAARAFRQLVERLQTPVVTTWNALDLIADSHPLCVGRPGSVALRAPNFAVQNSDLLISIGARLDNVVTAYNTPGFARAARKVVVDVDCRELDKHDMDISVRAAVDAGVFIDALLARADHTQPRDGWLRRCRDWKARYTVRDGQVFAEKGPVSHYHFVSVLSEELGEDELVVTGSSGLAVEVFYTAFANKPGQRVFLTSGLGAMGYGLPATIGACLAAGRRPLVSVEGDGSLQLNIQELSTLKQQNLPIRMFVMNNRGYASIRNTQRNYFKGRYVATGSEAGLYMPDISALAKAIGLSVMRIEDASDLRAGIREALGHRGPLICDVDMVADERLWPKVAAIPQRDGSIVSMPLEDMSPLLPLEVLQREMLIPLLPESQAARRNQKNG